MSVRRIDEERKIFIPVLSGCCGHNNKATNWVGFQDCTYVCGMFGFCSAGSKGEDVKTLIESLLIGCVITINYISVLIMIVLSSEDTFGKITMVVYQTILSVATLNYLGEGNEE